MSNREIRKIIRAYADLLRKKRIRFSRIYLFGSQAEGRAHEYSDIDLAVIVDKRPAKGYLDRKIYLRKLTKDIDLRIEPTLLHKSELTDEGETIMGHEVRVHGILVVSN